MTYLYLNELLGGGGGSKYHFKQFFVFLKQKTKN